LQGINISLDAGSCFDLIGCLAGLGSRYAQPYAQSTGTARQNDTDGAFQLAGRPPVGLIAPALNRLLKIADDHEKPCGHAQRQPGDKRKSPRRKQSETTAIGVAALSPKQNKESRRAIQHGAVRIWQQCKTGEHTEDMTMWRTDRLPAREKHCSIQVVNTRARVSIIPAVAPQMK